MAAGHLKDFAELTELFGLPEILGQVIEAITNPRPQVMLSILIEEFQAPAAEALPHSRELLQQGHGHHDFLPRLFGRFFF